jgi:hypothetical protein
MDTTYFEDGSDDTTGNQSGTGAGRLEQDVCATNFRFNFVRQGALVQVNHHHVLFSDVGSFGNGCGYVCALGDTNADFVFTVANDDQRTEAEAAAALYNAGHAVDVQGALVELLLFWV